MLIKGCEKTGSVDRGFNGACDSESKDRTEQEAGKEAGSMP